MQFEEEKEGIIFEINPLDFHSRENNMKQKNLYREI